jgi:hypothetical protein
VRRPLSGLFGNGWGEGFTASASFEPKAELTGGSLARRSALAATRR